MYGIFTFQILVSTLFVGFVLMNPEITKWQVQNMHVFYILMVIGLICQITLMCYKRIARKVPLNYIVMLILTFCESYMLSLSCARYNPNDVFQIFILTAASFTAMSVYAIFTKKDLTIFGSIMSGASICMLTISFMMFFTATPLLRMVYSGLGVMLALLFVAVDTQMIL